jgi:hypothetical protein
LYRQLFFLLAMMGDGMSGGDQVGRETVEVIFYQLEREADGFFIVGFRGLARLGLL